MDVKLQVYSTSLGLMICCTSHPSGKFTFNGVESESLPDYGKTYKFLEGHTDIKEVCLWQLPYKSISHWELIDTLLESDSIPLMLKDADVASYIDYHQGGERGWEHKSNIRSLYQDVYETIEGYYKSFEFVIAYKGHIDGDITQPLKTTFSLNNGDCDSDANTMIENITHYSEVDMILVPDFAIHMKPCTITAKNSYDIIRSFILDHIDLTQARVTSNYDFCMTVEKFVHDRPSTKEVLIGKRVLARSPKIKTNKKKITYEIFSMAPRSYQNYDVISGFSGTSQQDLVDNINNYLKELIAKINEPKYTCECCNGLGYTI